MSRRFFSTPAHFWCFTSGLIKSKCFPKMKRTLGECHTSLHACLNELAPNPSESSAKSDPCFGVSSKEDLDEASGTGSHSTSLNVSAAANETDAFLDKLDLLIESGVSEEGNEQVSKTRLTFHERQEFVSANAEDEVE